MLTASTGLLPAIGFENGGTVAGLRQQGTRALLLRAA